MRPHPRCLLAAGFRSHREGKAAHTRAGGLYTPGPPQSQRPTSFLPTPHVLERDSLCLLKSLALFPGDNV